MSGPSERQRANAIRNSRDTKRQPPKTTAASINWDTCIANLKAMLNHLDRKYRQ